MKDESKRKRAGKGLPPRPRQRTRRSIEARPKLADVARVAAVSNSTASHALNPPETVS